MQFQLEIFRYIHSKGLVFHDVKPANIGVGYEDKNEIFFFDFAFSEFYVDAFGAPKRRERTTEINGTPEYFALAPLRGYTHMRKDDLFSLGVCLLEMNKADLPWMDKTSLDTDIHEAVDIVLEDWKNVGLEVNSQQYLNCFTV